MQQFVSFTPLLQNDDERLLITSYNKVEETLNRVISSTPYIVIFGINSPFFSSYILEKSIKKIKDEEREFLSFSRKLRGISPLLIIRSQSITTPLKDSVLVMLDELVKNNYLSSQPESNVTELKVNRYWDDRISLTPVGEFYDEEYCIEFPRLFGNWLVRNDKDIKRIAQRLSLYGLSEPNDDSIKRAIEVDMENNRKIVHQAVEKNLKGTREIRDANIALCRWEARHNVIKPQSFPISLWLGLTDRCNARCKFCKYCKEEVEGYAVELDNFKKLDWMRFLKRFYFHCGLGEPFCHPQILEILQYCRENYPALELRTATNASMLNEQICKAIAGYMTSVSFSINAATQKTFEKTMPPLKWDAAMHNLKTLYEEKKRQKTDKPEVNMTYVAHRDNIEELYKLPEIATRHGVNQIGVVHFHYKVSQYIQDYLFPKTHSLQYHQQLYNDCIMKAKAEAEKYHIKFYYPPLFPIGYTFLKKPQELPVGPEFGFQAGDNLCYHPWTRVFALPTAGLQRFCCTLGLQPGTSFIFSDSKTFHDYWKNHPALKEIRKTMNTANEMPSCRFCKTKNKRNPELRNSWIKAIKGSKKWLEAHVTKQLLDCGVYSFLQ